MDRWIVLRLAQAGVIGLVALLLPTSSEGIGREEILIVLAVVGVVLAASRLPAIAERMSKD